MFLPLFKPSRFKSHVFTIRQVSSTVLGSRCVNHQLPMMMLRILGHTGKAAGPSIRNLDSKPNFLRIRISPRKYSSRPTTHEWHVNQVPSTVVNQGVSALHSMMAEKRPPALIFQTIVNNAHSKVSSELTETFLFMLLECDDLDAAVSLVHVLFHADAKHYKLSNEFWSLMVTKAGTFGHHAAASLVYHEIVNPFTGVLAEAGLNQQSQNIPFLLLPTAIESLAIVFAQNGNHIAIEGLRQYFKRFYSYFGHRETYQTLLISQVESFSKATSLPQALQAFDTLAIRYRGHHRYRTRKDISHSLKYMVFSNFKERQRSISLNITADTQNGFVQNSRPLFFPEVKFNSYRRNSGTFSAIFDDVLMVEDLPQFRCLLRETIEELLAHEKSIVDRLIAFISKRHPSIFRVMLACLCDLGRVSEALAVINKMPDLVPTLKDTGFILSSDFARLFKALQAQISIQTSEACADHHQMLLDSYRLSQRLRVDMPSKCFHCFLSCYFLSPLANMSEITHIIKSRKAEGKQNIGIKQDAYQSAILRGFEASELEKIFNI